MTDAPIALFDSGSGGLAVLNHLQRRLPNESILYLGDLAHFPYGEKSKDAIVSYCLENGRFFEQMGAKMLIVGCNTASAFGLQALKESLSIPVIGLIEPCAKKVAKNHQGKVGILATQSTIRSKSYENAIRTLCPNISLFPSACPTLAYLIENGLNNHLATPFVVEAAIDKFKREHVDTLVLACSHYPLILHHIKKALGDQISIIDSTESCIDDIVDLLEARNLKNPSGKKGFERFFVSSQPDTLFNLAPLFLNRSIPYPELIAHKF